MQPDSPKTVRSLAVETSGRFGSVALGLGSTVVEARPFSTTQRHAAELLPVVDALCREHRVTPDAIDEVYVSGGPGSFTGLRIGITFARTLALAGSVNVVRVPTLDVIAQNALELADRPEHVAVVLDAKRKHIFAAPFARRDDRYEPTREPRELEPDAFFVELPRGCALLGEGIAYHAEAVERSGFVVLPEEHSRARAEIVHRLGFQRARHGQLDDPDRLTPIYIRRPEAEEVWERKHGSR